MHAPTASHSEELAAARRKKRRETQRFYRLRKASEDPSWQLKQRMLSRLYRERKLEEDPDFFRDQEAKHRAALKAEKQAREAAEEMENAVLALQHALQSAPK